MTTQIMNAMQAVIQDMDEFQTDSVSVCDWSFLDDSVGNAPWAIVEASGLISSIPDMKNNCPTQGYEVPVLVFVPLDDWDTQMPELVDLRTAVLNKFSETNKRNMGVPGEDYLAVNDIRDANPGNPIAPYQDPAIIDDRAGSPLFLQMTLIFSVEERF